MTAAFPLSAVRLRNLTPHRLRVVDHHGDTVLDLPAAAHPARLAQHVVEEAGLAGGVPVHTIRYGEPAGLPNPAPDVLFVVSRVLATHVRRADLLFPDEEIRDATGRIIGCRALARFPLTTTPTTPFRGCS